MEFLFVLTWEPEIFFTLKMSHKKKLRNTDLEKLVANASILR